MEHYRHDLEQIKQLSGQLMTTMFERDHIQEQLRQYKSSVSQFIIQYRRASSLMEIEHDPDIVSLTETTNNKIQTMEDKINFLDNQNQELNNKCEQLFEQRKILVQKVNKELNKTIVYAYPFGTEKPTIRMGKSYHITNEGDIACQLKFESNSYFSEEFHPII
jgi:hypothetical protein